MSAYPHWTLVVAGKHRCRHCGSFVKRAWCWFERPGRPTYALCEPCTEVECAKGSNA